MSPRERALEVLASVSKLPVDELRPDLHLVADLGIDSPRALRLLVELEDHFDVEIEDERAAMLVTVGDVLEFVESLER